MREVCYDDGMIAVVLCCAVVATDDGGGGDGVDYGGLGAVRAHCNKVFCVWVNSAQGV